MGILSPEDIQYDIIEIPTDENTYYKTYKITLNEPMYLKFKVEDGTINLYDNKR